MKKLIREFRCPGDHPNREHLIDPKHRMKNPELLCNKKVQIFQVSAQGHTVIEHENPPCKQYAQTPSEYKNFVLKQLEPERVLYAVCVEYWNERDGRNNPIWKKEIVHVHATSAPQARNIFTLGAAADYKHYRIVETAPVVGYFALDDNGDKVSA